MTLNINAIVIICRAPSITTYFESKTEFKTEIHCSGKLVVAVSEETNINNKCHPSQLTSNGQTLPGRGWKYKYKGNFKQKYRDDWSAFCFCFWEGVLLSGQHWQFLLSLNIRYQNTSENKLTLFSSKHQKNCRLYVLFYQKEIIITISLSPAALSSQGSLRRRVCS